MASVERGPRVFLRDASGLTKTIGVFGAVLFGVHCISLSSSGLIPFSWVASVWPGASIIGVLSIAMLTSLVHGYVFASIGAAMPRSGADYVLASRFVNPKLAFIASWTLVVFSGVVAGGLIAWIPKSAIPALLQPMAIIFGEQKYSDLALFASSPQGSVLIGTVCVLLTLGLMLLRNKAILRVLSLGLLLGLAAWAVILYVLHSASGPLEFQAAWDRFMSATGPHGAYASRLPLAKAAGMVISSNRTTMTLAGLIMGFWIFYGYYIPTFFAGEITSKATRTLLLPTWTSIVLTWAVFAGAALMLGRLVPEEWVAAEGYLFNNPDLVSRAAGGPVTAMPFITFYAAILYPKKWFVVLVAVAWIYTLLNLAQTYFFYSSRIIFSWSFDRVVPRFLADVTPTTKSPVYALLAIAVLAEVGVLDASFGGPLNTQLTFAFFAVVTQLVSVYAVTRLPKLAPEQYRLCPPFVRWQILGLPVISMAGFATLVYLCWMIAASFLFPAVGVASPIRTLGLLAVLSISGFAVFEVARRRRQKEGKFDLSVIYKSIPPE